MKRLLMSVLSVLMIVMLTVPSLATPAAAAKEITVLIDGEKQYYDPAPVVVNGRTLVPMRAIFEKLGMIIEWDNKTRTVRGYTMSEDLELTINSKWAFLNDHPIALDVPAQLIKGRTMVPIRFVGEALGAQVAWNEATSTVTIKSAHSVIEGGYMRDLMETSEYREAFAQVETNLHEVYALYSDWAEYASTPGTTFYVPPSAMRQQVLAKVQEVDDQYHYLKSLESYDQDLKYLLERYDQMINVFLYAFDNNSDETNSMTSEAFGDVADLFMALFYRNANSDGAPGAGCDSPFCWYNGNDPGEPDPYDPYPGNTSPQLPQGYVCDPNWEYPGYYVDGTFVPQWSLGELCHEEYYEEVGGGVSGDYLTPDDPRLPQTPPVSSGSWDIYDNTRYGFTVKNPWGEGLRATNGDGMAWSMMDPNSGSEVDIRVYGRTYTPTELHTELRDHASRIRLDDGTFGNLMIEHDSYNSSYAYMLQIQKGTVEYIFSAEVDSYTMVNRFHAEIMAALRSFHVR